MSFQLKNISSLFLLLLSLSLYSQNTGIVSQNGLLTVSGNTIVNENNLPFSTAGNSIYWSGFPAGIPFYQPEVVSYLSQEWSSGIIRTAMAVEESNGGLNVFSPSLPNDIINLRGIVNTSSEGFFRNPEREMAKVRAVIDAAIGNDMYVIVDFHTHFAHLLQPEAEAFFTTIATEYGEYDNIIYEIFNEPIGLASYRSGANNSAAFSEFEETWDQIIKPYAIDLVNLIRAIDPDNLIVVGTPGFDQGVVTASEDPLSIADLSQENIDNGAALNVAYALHFYAGTHGQGLRNLALEALTDDPNNPNDSEIALMVTEWGTVQASGDGAVALDETIAWMNFLREHNITHANWSVTDLSEGASIVQPNTGTNGLFSNNLTGTGRLLRCIIENWDTDTFGDCDTSNDAPSGAAIKVEVETPVGQVDPGSGANSDFWSPGLSASTRADGEGILTGFTQGQAAAYRINGIEAGNNFRIEVEYAASNSGFFIRLERDAGATQLATQVAPSTGSLNNYQVLTFDGIPFSPNNNDIAISIVGNPGGSINIESFTYSNGDLGEPVESNSCDGITTTFEDGAWAPSAPTSIDQAIINENYDTAIEGNIQACTLVISPNTTLTIADNTYLETFSDITVEGTLNIANAGSVVQLDNAANVIKATGGAINLTKNTPLLSGRDFVLLSSPMNGETNGGVYGEADRVFKLIPENFIPNNDEALADVLGNFIDDNGDYLDNLFINNPNINNDASGTTNPIVPTEGYLVFPQSFSVSTPINYEHTYSEGTLNNGILVKDILHKGPETVNNFNLLGNPYPSAIDTRDFIRLNSAVDAVYFWEHITTPNATFPGGYAVNHSMDDVSLHNLVAGIPAVNGSTTPGPYMTSGQGFGILANQEVNLANVHFNNSMRVRDFNGTVRSSLEQENKLWLRLDSEAYSLKSTMAIAFVPQASAALDKGYDTNRLATTVALYSTASNGQQLAIQGRESFNPEMQIPVGFSTQIDESETYTISIDHFEGINLDAHNILLLDNTNGAITSLKEESYSFLSPASDQTDRFTLLFEDAFLSTNDLNFEDSLSVYPNPAKNHITLRYTGNQNLSRAILTGLEGKILKSYNLKDFSNSTLLDLNAISPGIYFLTIEGATHATTKKILIK